MALYCQNMLQIALELAADDPIYLEQAQTFLEHFAWIAVAVNRPAGTASMWDDEDGFFYDLLRLPDGSATRLKVRSMVGLLPLAAATVLEPRGGGAPPAVPGADRLRSAANRADAVPSGWRTDRGRDADGMRCWPCSTSRGCAGSCARCSTRTSSSARTASARCRGTTPTTRSALDVDGQRYEVVVPAGRVRQRHVRRQLQLARPDLVPDQRPDDPRAAQPATSATATSSPSSARPAPGVKMTLFEVAREISDRLTRIFLPDADGRRPCYGGQRIFAEDEHWRDLVLFPEYFHGDNGAGLGASHQTGWTGLVAVFPNLFAGLDGADLLDRGLATASGPTTGTAAHVTE